MTIRGIWFLVPIIAAGATVAAFYDWTPKTIVATSVLDAQSAVKIAYPNFVKYCGEQRSEADFEKAYSATLDTKGTWFVELRSNKTRPHFHTGCGVEISKDDAHVLSWTIMN